MGTQWIRMAFVSLRHRSTRGRLVVAHARRVAQYWPVLIGNSMDRRPPRVKGGRCGPDIVSHLSRLFARFPKSCLSVGWALLFDSLQQWRCEALMVRPVADIKPGQVRRPSPFIGAPRIVALLGCS